jgi:hypothetical protein
MGLKDNREIDHVVHSARHGDHAVKLAVYMSSFDFPARSSRRVPGQWILFGEGSSQKKAEYSPWDP